MLEWFGDSTKEGDRGNYGYIKRVEKPDSQNIKVHWKGLICPVEEIKGYKGKGVLVTFNASYYKDKEEARNVQPLRLAGYLIRVTNTNQSQHRLAVIDTSIAFQKYVDHLLKINKQVECENNLNTHIHKKEVVGIPIKTKKMSCVNRILHYEDSVCFGIRFNNTDKKYEAVELSLLNEENQDFLKSCLDTQNPQIFEAAFKKYITYLTNDDAVKFALDKYNELSSFKSRIEIKSILSDEILLNKYTKSLRELLPLKEQLKLCLKMINLEQDSNDEVIIDELFTVVKKIFTFDKDANYSCWKSIDTNLIIDKIAYKGFLWNIIPDFVKTIVVIAYLKQLPVDNVDKAVKLVKDIFLEFDTNKKKLISSIPNELKYGLRCQRFRDVLPINNKLDIYHYMFDKYSKDDLENYKVINEIFYFLTTLPNDKRELWFNRVENKITYNDLLYYIAPDKIRLKVSAKYLQKLSDTEALQIAKNVLNEISNQNDKVEFVNLIPNQLKTSFEGYVFRNVLPDQSKLDLYELMIDKYTDKELAIHGVEQEIVCVLQNLPDSTRKLWLDKNFGDKIKYKGFLWSVYPDEIKEKILKKRFTSFLNVIEAFKSEFEYKNDITTDTKTLYAQLSEQDECLAKQWMSSEYVKNDYMLAQMLSARAAEKFTIKFYQSIGFTVEDVSLKQITESYNQDWINYDLRLINNKKTLYVDVKNARTTFSNRNNDKKGYSEFCVQKFKKNRNKDEIIIAGVLSPYVKPEQIKESSKIHPRTSPIIFMGEITEKEISEIENHFLNQFSSVIMPRDTQKLYLPPWLFDYPIEPFYSQRKQAVLKLRNLNEFDFPEWEDIQILKINFIPIFIEAKMDLPEHWKTHLAKWKIDLIDRFNKIDLERITLPYVFLTLLSHFLDTFRSGSTSFHPAEYKDLIYYQNNPLGICDPIKTIEELCNILSIVWDNKHKSKIDEFKIFRFKGRGLLEGKKDSKDSLKTIIAYCGGRLETTNVVCGLSPLILGQHNNCHICGKLICPEPGCGFCKDGCLGKEERKQQIMSALKHK